MVGYGKNIYFLPLYKNVIIWSHPTENQARMSRDRFLLIRCTLDVFQFLPFSWWSYTPLASLREVHNWCHAHLWCHWNDPTGNSWMSSYSWRRHPKKNHKKSMVRNKHLSGKKTWKNWFTVFMLFFRVYDAVEVCVFPRNLAGFWIKWYVCPFADHKANVERCSNCRRT